MMASHPPISAEQVAQALRSAFQQDSESAIDLNEDSSQATVTHGPEEARAAAAESVSADEPADDSRDADGDFEFDTTSPLPALAEDSSLAHPAADPDALGDDDLDAGLDAGSPSLLQDEQQPIFLPSSPTPPQPEDTTPPPASGVPALPSSDSTPGSAGPGASKVQALLSNLSIVAEETAPIRPERAPRKNSGAVRLTRFPSTDTKSSLSLGDAEPSARRALEPELEPQAGAAGIAEDLELDDGDDNEVGTASTESLTSDHNEQSSNDGTESDDAQPAEAEEGFEEEDEGEEEEAGVEEEDEDEDEAGVEEEDEDEDEAGGAQSSAKRASVAKLFKKQSAIKYSASTPSGKNKKKRKRKAAQLPRAASTLSDSDRSGGPSDEDKQTTPTKKARSQGRSADAERQLTQNFKGISLAPRHDATSAYLSLPPGLQEAAAILFGIAKYGPVDPAQIGDEALLLDLPLEYPSEVTEEDPSAQEENSSWTKHAIDMRRSKWIASSRWLQLAIDICAWTLAHRRATLAARQSQVAKADLERAITEFMKEDFARFPDANTDLKTAKKEMFNVKDHRLVGIRLLSLTSILGSFAFLPILLLSERLDSFNKVRRLSPATLAALSFLLRGGRPDMNGLSPQDVRTVKAAVFTANVVIPFSLRWYMASVTTGFDDATSAGRDVSPVSMYVCPRPAGPEDSGAGTYLPQPAMDRQGSDGTQAPPLEFGLMSGYGRKKVPVVNPPLAMLGPNYFKSVQAPEPLRDRGRRMEMQLQHLFKKDLPEDSSHPAKPTTPTVDLMTEPASLGDMINFGAEYCALLRIPDGHAGFRGLLEATANQDLLFSSEDLPSIPVPTLTHLRARQVVFRQNSHPFVQAGSFVIEPPASILELSSDSDLDQDEDEDMVNDMALTQVSHVVR
ncbi:hypothetical protein OC845_006059 [Tilletia horrida]|nr:hypothetical protein OC845_006059 [Tilletia horrida]